METTPEPIAPGAPSGAPVEAQPISQGPVQSVPPPPVSQPIQLTGADLQRQQTDTAVNTFFNVATTVIKGLSKIVSEVISAVMGH